MRDIQNIIVVAAWVSLGIIIFFILYRKLLKRLSSKKMQKELYLVLYPIEKNPVQGVITIYFEMHAPLEVEISIFSKGGSFHQIIEHKKFKSGGNIISFDTKNLSNGFYFYQAQTQHQKSRKLIEVIN